MSDSKFHLDFDEVDVALRGELNGERLGHFNNCYACRMLIENEKANNPFYNLSGPEINFAVDAAKRVLSDLNWLGPTPKWMQDSEVEVAKRARPYVNLFAKALLTLSDSDAENYYLAKNLAADKIVLQDRLDEAEALLGHLVAEIYKLTEEASSLEIQDVMEKLYRITNQYEYMKRNRTWELPPV